MDQRPEGQAPLRRLSDDMRDTRASTHLDMVRGLAAVAVLLFHVRYRFFVDYSESPDSGPLTVAWYVVTAFGHDAVVVFFVLSGFLIGSTVVRAHLTRTWSWREYLTSRYVRLYTVLVPGLLATLFWDQLGMRWFGDHVVYTGAPQAYQHDLFDVGLRSSAPVLLGNLLYLQTILVEPFGSNDALWSLAYESWYYIVFPVLAYAFLVKRSPSARALWVAACGGLLLFVGPRIALYFPFWLVGVGIGLLPPLRPLQKRPGLWAALVSSCFVAVVATAHVAIERSSPTDKLLLLDSITASAFALCLFTILHDRRSRREDFYTAMATRLAGCSFTLYVVHLPLLVFMRAWLVPERPWTASPAAVSMGLLIAATTFLYAVAFAALTEARTSAIKRRVLAILPTRRPTKQERMAPNA